MTKRKGVIGFSAGVVLYVVLVPFCWGVKGPKHPFPFDMVEVAPIVIEPVSLIGAPPHKNEEGFIQHLSVEATKRAERSLVECRIAKATEQLPVESVARGGWVLTGTVRLPISLPPHLAGYVAAYHSGSFVTTKVTLFRGNKTNVSSAEVTLRWRDAWWYTGGKQRFDRPFDHIVQDFVRKSIDLAVRKLTRDERLQTTDA